MIAWRDGHWIDGEDGLPADDRGLTLGDMERLTGIDRSALSKLERCVRPNVTFETLARYAAALGKELVIDLADTISPRGRRAVP